MKTKYIFVIVILFIVVIGFAVWYQNRDLSERILLEPSVCFDETCFDVEIADDVEERTKGLMFREDLDKDEGMLFVFEQTGVYPFWMKNTPLSLDIIWMDSEFSVVYVANRTTPFSTNNIDPGAEAKYVLEINAGLSDEYEIKTGSVGRLEPKFER